MVLIDPLSLSSYREELEKSQEVSIDIFVTHKHRDHYQGALEIKKSYPRVQLFCPPELSFLEEEVVFYQEGQVFSLTGDKTLKMIATPGHTAGHFSFILEDGGNPQAFFAGDALFNSGIGNCRDDGSLEDFYESIKKIFTQLPDSCHVYPGHDYGEKNTQFALALTGYSPEYYVALEKWREIFSADQVVFTTIGEERTINPFASAPSLEHFVALRKKRDLF